MTFAPCHARYDQGDIHVTCERGYPHHGRRHFAEYAPPIEIDGVLTARVVEW